MKLEAIFTAAVIGLTASFGANSASASTVSYTSDGPVCDAVFDVDPDADACFGSSDGNAQKVDVNMDTFDGEKGLFGYTDWSLIQAVPEVSGTPKSGNISIAANTSSMVAVLLKSGPQFAAYRFDDGLNGDLDFTTANDKGLSNYLVVGRDISAVPVPAAGFLLLGALGGFAALRRRKAL